MPAFCAAASTVVPGLTFISFPSIVMVIDLSRHDMAPCDEPYCAMMTTIAYFAASLYAAGSSPEKLSRIDRNASGLEWPRPHFDAVCIVAANWRSVCSVSLSSPFFSHPLYGFCRRTLPTRHGMHWPQDSSEKKCWKFSATANMSWFLPKTMIEPPVAKSPGVKVRSNWEGNADATRAADLNGFGVSGPTSVKI